jgi:hypothetical protein
VDATTGNGCRQGPIEHHVTDGDQVMGHARRLISGGDREGVVREHRP